jgi:hypothetical protein
MDGSQRVVDVMSGSQVAENVMSGSQVAGDVMDVKTNSLTQQFSKERLSMLSYVFRNL